MSYRCRFDHRHREKDRQLTKAAGHAAGHPAGSSTALTTTHSHVALSTYALGFLRVRYVPQTPWCGNVLWQETDLQATSRPRGACLPGVRYSSGKKTSRSVAGVTRQALADHCFQGAWCFGVTKNRSQGRFAGVRAQTCQVSAPAVARRCSELLFGVALRVISCTP